MQDDVVCVRLQKTEQQPEEPVSYGTVRYGTVQKPFPYKARAAWEGLQPAAAAAAIEENERTALWDVCGRQVQTEKSSLARTGTGGLSCILQSAVQPGEVGVVCLSRSSHPPVLLLAAKKRVRENGSSLCVCTCVLPVQI